MISDQLTINNGQLSMISDRLSHSLPLVRNYRYPSTQIRSTSHTPNFSGIWVPGKPASSIKCPVSGIQYPVSSIKYQVSMLSTPESSIGISMRHLPKVLNLREESCQTTGSSHSHGPTSSRFQQFFSQCHF